MYKVNQIYFTENEMKEIIFHYLYEKGLLKEKPFNEKFYLTIQQSFVYSWYSKDKNDD